MFGKEAICPDGLFVPVVFQESDFYPKSLKYAKEPFRTFFLDGVFCILRRCLVILFVSQIRK
jgi:hypothetical protein